MRFRFSLRVFLICFTIVAIVFGGAANFVYRVKDQVRRHKAAIAFLSEAGWNIESQNSWFDQPVNTSRTHTFIRTWVDCDYGHVTGAVECDRKLTPDEAKRVLPRLLDLQGVDEIRLEMVELNQEVVDILSAHRKIDSLSLTYECCRGEVEKQLDQFQSLKRLSLEGFVSDRAIPALNSMPLLNHLSIELCHLTPASAESFAKLSQLEGLAIRGELSESACLRSLLSLPKLSSISLYKAVVTEGSLRSFSDAAALKSVLIMGDIEASASFFSDLARAPKIEQLTWWAMSREDKPPIDLRGLADFPCLEQIGFMGVSITRSELLALRRLRTLQSFHFSGTLDKETLAAFLAAVPDCKIEMRNPEAARCLPDGWNCSLVDGKLKCESYVLPKCGMSSIGQQSDEEVQLAEHFQDEVLTSNPH